MADVFGDLRDWAAVLKQVNLLSLAGELDEHQEGLARLLRYRYNWQLRQAALRAVLELKRPSKELLDVLLRIVADDYCDMETRVLACDAVRHAINGRHSREDSGELKAEAAHRANEILRTPQPPKLLKAVEAWLAPGELAGRALKAEPLAMRRAAKAAADPTLPRAAQKRLS